MRRKIILLITLLLILDDVFGKKYNKTIKQTEPFHKTDSNNKYSARLKRALDDGAEKILISDKENVIDDSSKYEYIYGKVKSLKLKPTVEDELPFWGNRGRRESFSDETVPDVQLPIPKLTKNKILSKVMSNINSKIKDEVSPFWSNRGRRYSGSSEDDDLPEDLFWANRGRRQDDEPFWGTRGRRQESESPFWGNRGRRENLVSPYWSSKNTFDDDGEPFWGNRGRRQEQEPFWGNRGKREPIESFLGHGTNKAKSLYLYKNIIDHKNELQDSNDVIKDFGNHDVDFERNRRQDIPAPFWINRGRDSKIKFLFNGLVRNRMGYNPNISNKYLPAKTFEQNTVHDDRMYAEEPHFILVERSSRSSAEDDPFFITRGKKYSDSEFADAARGRRGALEEIVKSVRNDPYYIARGKKDYIKVGNSNTTQSQFLKTRNLICATVELLMLKYSDGNKVKREILDNDRDRRTILKKLALQLQMDPYFVSRGKRDGENNITSDALEQFINKVIVLCN